MSFDKFSSINSKTAWRILLALHIVLCLFAFKKVWFYHDEYLFTDISDGLKNYYIMESYLEHDSPKGVLHYGQMNYPFGEYVYYTDNTPLFSLFVKLFSRYIFNIVPYSLFLFHLLTAINILLAARLSWLIVKRFINTGWLRFVLALAIPWCNIQITRIEVTSNLAYSAIILTVIYLLILIYENRNNYSKLRKYWILSIALFSLSFFIHGYYIMLTGISFFAFHVFWMLYDFKRENLRVKIIGLIVPLVAIVLSYSLVIFTDPWLHLRLTRAEGYDWINWKTQFLGIFSAFKYHYLKFPFAGYEWINYESHVYLGAFTLYGICIIALYLIYKQRFRTTVKKYFTEGTNSKLLLLLLITGFASLIISFGNEYNWDNTGIRFYNVFNPFYWLLNYFPFITQFRVLGRFAWIFYFPAILCVAFLLERILLEWKDSKILKVVAAFLVFCLLIDTYCYVRHIHNEIMKRNPIRSELVNKVPVNGISPNEYQAILPIPYMNVGSEDYKYTFDAVDDKWSAFTFNLSLKSGLPLMSAIIGRLSDYQSKAFTNIFLEYRMDSTIKTLLTDKPILVVVGKRYPISTNTLHIPAFEPARTAFLNTANFADSLRLPKVYENDSVVYYSWKYN